ncbi:hypothetical protein U9M48_042001 [Paspalum notatum var. saurae]|uniref:BED-type domain-containing protein n=1 Tax=Paspalum notatum var. saurae TaxID=547442 RepID=A0AAQ3UQH3_PASNO
MGPKLPGQKPRRGEDLIPHTFWHANTCLTGIDDVWPHGEPVGTGSRCYYCHKILGGGGKTRLREHLAGVTGDAKVCLKVPKDVRKVMAKDRLDGIVQRGQNRARRQWVEDEIARAVDVNVDEVTVNDYVDILPSDEEGQLQVALKRSMVDLNMRSNGSRTARAGGASGSRTGCPSTSSTRGYQRKIDRGLRKLATTKRSGGFDIDLARSRAPVQQRIDVAFDKDRKDKLGRAWSKWFHANDIAGRKANCPYFKAAMRLTQQFGEGVPCPTGEAIDGPYLERNYEELMENMESCKNDWDQYKNASFLYDCIKTVVVDEIGEDRVMQVVTDNGSNYRKACLDLASDYPKINWQPCAAHTINLLLKNIGQLRDVDRVICSAQRICRFFYNHNRLHAEMKRHIGGELYRWNATRFGTVYIFLQSFWDRMDKFRQWMVSEEWKNSDYNRDPEYKYTDQCLSNRQWWDNVKFVLDLVGPIYSLLRFADSQKIGTVSRFLPRVMACRGMLEVYLSDRPEILKNILQALDGRVKNMCKNTLMLAAGVLDPEGHYNYDTSSNPEYLMELAIAIERVADSPQSAVRLISEFQYFKANKGMFGSTTARLAALSPDVTPANWWSIYGGDTKELQKYALRIVSQCVSSSGFYVHYNLKLQVQQLESEHQEKEKNADPFRTMIDVALFDHSNPITEWFNGSMYESDPVLDEADGRPSKSLQDLVHQACLDAKRKRTGHGHSKRRRKVSSEDEFDEHESESDEEDQQDYNETWKNHSNDEASEEEQSRDLEMIEGAGKDIAPRSRRTLNEDVVNLCNSPASHGDDEGREPAGEDDDARPVRTCRKKTVDINTLLGRKK